MTPTDSPVTSVAGKPGWLKWLRRLLLFLSLLFVVYLYQLLGPGPQIVVSPQTTFITAPLRSDGLPDYKQYVHDASRVGVTPENNAAVPLFRAMRAQIKPEHRDIVATELGMDDTSAEDVALVLLNDNAVCDRILNWLEARASTEPRRDKNPSLKSDERTLGFRRHRYSHRLDQFFKEAARMPWKGEDVPPLAEWVEESEEALDLIVAASRLPKFYFPSPSFAEESPDGLSTIERSGVTAAREAARCLSIRATNHIGEGRLDDAWEDSLAIHRLARLVGQGSGLIDQMLALAIDEIACEATTALLADQKLSTDLARKIQLELKAMKPAFSMATAIDEGERLAVLDVIVNFHRQKAGEASQELGGAWLVRWVVYDWNQILARFNQRFDQAAAAVRLTERSAHKKAADRFLADLRSERIEATNPLRWAHGFFSRDARTDVLRGDLGAVLLPAIGAVCDVEDRSNTRLDLTRLAAALAVYRTDHQRYPDKLDDLVPHVLDTIPLDRFSAKPFIYKCDPDGQGYLLYSVSQNGFDDGGTNVDGTIVKGKWVEVPEPSRYDFCDLVIRVPQPPLRVPELDISSGTGK